MRPRTGARRARPGRGTSPRPTGCRRRRPRAAAPPRPAPASCGTPRRSPPPTSPPPSRPSSERIATAAASSAGRTSSCFSTSTTGQYVIPSPYGRQRPRTTVASMEARASAASRDLPTPASPTTVTSSQRCSDRTRSHASSQDRELALTAHEQLPVPALRRVTHPQQPIGGNRVGLALQLERFDRLDVGCVADERERRLADQHLTRLRRLLQPSGDVDRVPGREPLLRPRHHLTRHDADPPLQPQLGQRVSHLHGRPHRAQRVVLVQHRHAEHGHHRIADELLHAPAVPLHDRLHPLEIARQQRPQPLGIERLAQLGRAGEVAEEHRHRLALLLRSARAQPRTRGHTPRRTWRPRRSHAHNSCRSARTHPRAVEGA